MLHKVVWTSEKISDFWNKIDRLIEKKVMKNNYFSSLVGSNFLSVVERKVKFKGMRILDYGCGIGIISETMLKKYKPKRVYGCDTAAESVKQTNDRCRAYRNWGGAFVIQKDGLPFKDSSFDIVIITEVIEHLSDNELDFVFSEVGRILSDNGIVIMTTPNNEDLMAATVVCPDCGCYFHRYQHVRSWSDSSLEGYLKKYNIVKKNIIKTTLIQHNTWFRRCMARLLFSVLFMIGRQPKNLIFIGKIRKRIKK